LRFALKHVNIILMHLQVYRRLIVAAILLLTILMIGTVGYWLITDREYSLLDTFYMTFITITTIGFGEILGESHSGIRAFTIFIAICGIGVIAYTFTSLTALIVEGEVTKSFWRRRMEKTARELKEHYIVCGLGRVALYIVNELSATKRPRVIVEVSKDKIENPSEELRGEVFVEGDATNENTLLKAGIKNARGVFAVTGDDNQNLVMSLTAKQLNPRVRVVARCNNLENREKLIRAGADAVVSPGFIGGMRMVSEMIRPAAVSFLDMMLRDKEQNLRVEEVPVPECFVGKTISALNLKQYRSLLLLAVATKEGWIYNPPDNHVLKSGSIFICMTTPEGRQELEKLSSPDI
jgi:voltage-gated potassium channel